MSTITTKDGVEIFYKDWGKGQPIVFSHGWPLSADDWDGQMLFFLKHGYRVIAHDRRGHDRSTQVSDGHDMDHYADDLASVTAHLDLKNAVHVGHSHRWRRSGALYREAWREPRGESSYHFRSPTADGEDRGQSGWTSTVLVMHGDDEQPLSLAQLKGRLWPKRKPRLS